MTTRRHGKAPLVVAAVFIALTLLLIAGTVLVRLGVTPLGAPEYSPLPQRDTTFEPGTVHNPAPPGTRVEVGAARVTVERVFWDDTLAVDIALAPGSGEVELVTTYIQPSGREFRGGTSVRADGNTRIATNIALDPADVVEGGVLNVTDTLSGTSGFTQVPVPLPTADTGTRADPLPHERRVKLAGSVITPVVTLRQLDDDESDPGMRVVLRGSGGSEPLTTAVEVAYKDDSGVYEAIEVTDELGLGDGGPGEDWTAVYLVVPPARVPGGALRLSDGKTTVYYLAEQTPWSAIVTPLMP